MVLLALSGLVIWTSIRVARAADEVARTTRVSDAWYQALLSTAAHTTMLQQDRVTPRPSQRVDFAAESALFRDALVLLAEAEHEGEHRAHVSAVAAEYDGLVAGAERMFDAADAADATAVATLHDREVGPRSAALLALVREGVLEERDAAKAATASLQRLNAVVLLATPLVLLAGTSLLLVFWRVVRGYQRGVERQARHNEYQALHDTLTGLPNRVLLHDRFEQAIRAAQREDGDVALLLMDLDRFKEINDTLGHHYGDALLTEVGPRLRRALRAVDTLARLGGDEFAILLPDVAGADGARNVAMRLLEELRAPFVLDGLPLSVDASIGAVLYPAHGNHREQLLQRADIAMYAAKKTQAGYVVFDPTLDQHSQRRLLMLSELRRALQCEELVLHYQPKVDVRTGEMVGVEALVRWQHPSHGLLGPGEFIPIADTTGLMEPLTRYVLARALRQCRQWQDAGHILSMAVNVPTRCLLNAGFPDDVAELLADAQVAAGLLVLEVTEDSIMTEPGRATAVLGRLKAMGVQLAIDDFGTGYSSMSYLKTLPVHELKVDRSFVRQMAQDRGDAVIVRSTVDLAHNLGLRVVAEGVEDLSTWQQLERMGCDIIQGFYLGRPMTPADLEGWLRERPLAIITPAETPAGMGPLQRDAADPAALIDDSV